MNKLFKTFAKHFGREDAITIVNGVNSNSNKGGDDDNQVKIVSIEYDESEYNATVTLNKEVTQDDVCNHLKIFVSTGDRRHILEYSMKYNDNIYMNSVGGGNTTNYMYKITINNKQLVIQDTTDGNGPYLTTICWL